MLTVLVTYYCLHMEAPESPASHILFFLLVGGTMAAALAALLLLLLPRRADLGNVVQFMQARWPPE